MPSFRSGSSAMRRTPRASRILGVVVAVFVFTKKRVGRFHRSSYELSARMPMLQNALSVVGSVRTNSMRFCSSFQSAIVRFAERRWRVFPAEAKEGSVTSGGARGDVLSKMTSRRRNRASEMCGVVVAICAWFCGSGTSTIKRNSATRRDSTRTFFVHGR